MQERKQVVICGNNIETLKNYPDNYFDAVVTDPPYGLGKEPNAEEMLRAWIDTGYLEVSGSGFMGKEWDAFVPQPLFWKEIFRVLKYGGHIVSFFGTRTYDWGCMAIRLAGFEIRDCIQWVYGCLSDDTEILTKNGYIPYHKFKDLPNFGEQEILIYDIENDIYKWEKPERWNDYNIHKDTCYRIKSNNTDQIVSRNHRCLVEREGKLVFIQAELLSEMEYMPTLSDDFFELQKTKVLQSSMQRILSGSRMEEMGQNRFRNSQFTTQQNEKRKQRGKKPCVEGWNNLSKKERILFGCEVEVCEMPERIYSNGEERWLRGGISVSNGKSDMQTFVKNRVRSSYRPQSNEQRHKQPNAICNEQGTQAIRVGRSYSTTLATITPFEYTGVIFCPTVSTGCFVARRNGKIFITGNSGFPKSHNISKAIDKMNGTLKIIGKGKAGKTALGQSSEWNNTNKPHEFDRTEPNCEQAKQWEGWGSALKPAHEDLVLARKPFQFSSDFVNLYENIVYELKLQICQSKLFAKDVKEIFTLSQKELQKVELDFAQWSVGKPFNTMEDLLVLMDMLQLELREENTTLNIVLLWLNTLVELWNVANTYTTETESSTITELRILNSLEWESIFQNITVLKNNKTNGLIANVLTVESIFSVLNLKLNDILTHFAKENVTLKESEKNFVPNSEQIVLARKPLEKGLSIAENVLKWGTGAINIDASRIGNELIKGQKAGQGFNNVKGFGVNTKKGDESAKEYISEDINGRFPANFIMTHHPDCKCVGMKKVGSGKEGGYNYEGNVYNVEGFVPNNSPTANSNYGQEIIENWECVDDCPIKILDEQSGILNQQGVCKTDNKSGWQNNYVGGGGVNAVERKLYLDKGGASRFFYIAKANKWERNYGLDGFEEKQTTGGGGGIGDYLQDINSASGKYGSEKAISKNFHPTVKPIKLMQYLVRLITPPNGIVLDPFAGSGTTGIACKIDGFEFVGIELSEDYTKIANARIESFQEENVFIDETIIYKNRNKEEDENNDKQTGNDWIQLTLF